jgi:diguanylate cyclase (GGDEF)-like protein
MRTTPVSARPIGVLIASKQEWTSRSLESILVPRGYLVLKTYTGAQARSHIRRHRMDAIIIDERLPDADGYALCHELRAEGLITSSTSLFLILSRPPTRRDRLAALRAGAWACLSDPLDAEELVAMLGVYVPAKLDAEQARAEGLVDELTGVYNVRGLTRRTQELGAHASRNHAALGCVLLTSEPTPSEDAPAGGDDPPTELVRHIAAALRSTARHSDAIGRLGPSAFAVIAMDTDAGQARRLAERLAAAVLAEPTGRAEPLPRFRLHAGCHGVPDFHAARIDSAELMRRATAALQKARLDSSGASLRGFDEGSAGSLP